MLFIRRAKCGAYARPWVTEFGTASYASSEACWWHNSGSAEINGVCQLGPLRERGPPLLPQFRGFHPLVLPRVGGILFLRLDDVATRYNYVTKIKLNNFFHDGKNETNQKRCSNEEFNLHSCIVFDFGLRISGKQHQQSHDRFIDFIVCSDALLDFQCRFHSHFPWCFGHFGCEWLLNCCVCRCFDCYHCCDDCCHCCFPTKNPISNSNLTWYFNQSKSFISNAWFFSW